MTTFSSRVPRTLKVFIPRGLLNQIKLLKVARRYPLADYIGSSNVSPNASIGRRCSIRDEVIINPGVSIGDYTYINRGSIIFSGNIGKFCSIAHYVQIGAEQHPVRHLSTSPYVYSDHSVTGTSSGFVEISRPPIIGSDVWIGSAAIIMQGVTIGHGAIIGAGAVVTKDVAPYTVVAGVPAGKIGVRFADPVVERLLSWRWWDLPDDELTAMGPLVAAGERWMEHL